jgi:hypothetical protein
MQVVKEGTDAYLATWKKDPPSAEKKKEEEEITLMEELGRPP